MKYSSILVGALSLFSQFLPTCAESWVSCLCEQPNSVDYCATAKACGNRKQNHRFIANDGWCDANDLPIDGPEFSRNCKSKGSSSSCCIRGSEHSDGCHGAVKRSLEELYKRTLDPSSLSLSEIKAAAFPRDNGLDRRTDKREISLNCISPYGTTFKMAIVEIAVTLGTNAVTFTVDKILNSDHIINLAVTFLKDSIEVGFNRLQMVDGGVRTVTVPDGTNGVVFLTA